MPEVFTYFELWTALQAAGGTRVGQFMPVAPKRRRRVTGDDALTFAVPKSSHLVASFLKNAVAREILSLDGATWREWVIDRVARGTGGEVVLVVECVGVLTTLTHYPITTTDADGFVYRETGAIQLPPATVIDDYLLANAPAFWGAGTVTPTDPCEVPFSGDSALSGGRRLEEVLPGYELYATPDGTTGYDLNFAVLGASAPTLYLRLGKQVKALRREELPGQITRLNQFQGADGDDGPSGIAWAYWEVTATSGAGPYLVTLSAIHGGPGPIAFDDQLNHAGLPGGANSLYLEKRDGTFIQITDSIASTQQVQVSSLTNISAGDWVRIVASSTGLHLTSLDAPTELATHGVLAGRFESGWDDALCVVKNSLQEGWSGSLPDNWTGLGAKTTTDGEWLTAGQALHIDQSVTDGAQIAAPPARSWFIRPRRTTYSAVAWIRLLSAHGAGSITFRVKVGSTVVGSGLEYVSPVNAWRQLKIEGLDLSAYAGTTQTLTVEIVKSGGTGTVDMLVDSMCLFPALSARAVTTGSNAARIWQGANAFLDAKRGQQVAYRGSLVDLARLGRANQDEIVPGGTAVIEDDELGTVTTRVMEIEDAPDNPGESAVLLSTVPPRFTRQLSKPAKLVIPFFEPIAVRVADRDSRNAAIRIKAEVTDSDATEVEVTLTVEDSLGGSPTVTYEAFGATYVSGSAYGPYVFTKPTATSGVGRVVFTASYPGREDVYDAVDVPEQAATGPSLDVRAQPGASNYTITWSGDGVELSIDGASYGSPPSSPITVARNAAGGASKEYTFRGTKDGSVVTNTVTVPPVDADTVTPDLTVAPGTQTSTTMPFTVNASNPKSGGAAPTITVTTKGCTGSSDVDGSISEGTPKAITSGAIVTINRPAWGSDPAMVDFTATLSGGGTETITRTVLNQDRTNFGPNLQVTAAPGSTSYDIHYTAEGGSTLTYSVDNGSFTSLGSSPLSVSRNTAGGADKVVTIKAVYEGITQTDSVTVPAQGSGGGTNPPAIPAFYVTNEDAGTNVISLAWTVANAPAGYTLNLLWNRTKGADGGNEGTITGISTTSPYNFDTDTHDGSVDIVSKGTGGAVKVDYLFELRMLDSGTVVAVATCAWLPYAVVTP